MEGSECRRAVPRVRRSSSPPRYCPEPDGWFVSEPWSSIRASSSALLLPSTTFNPSLSWNWLASSSPPPITLGFLPDFTEHPKPKRQKTVVVDPPKPKLPLSGADGSADDQDEEGEVTFLQDFMAGGMAGSASVIVGHPLDTLKVRVQNSAATSTSLMASITEYGGFSSLFRGMGAPLSAAAVVNAIVFSSYGIASRLYDCYVIDSASTSSSSNHDPWQKAMSCGAFAGLVQCVVICPMEHVKCRLQVQQDSGPSSGSKYKGPYQATKRIVREHGLRRLYQGWWSTVSREVPAFGLYFAVYDYMKDNVNTLLAQQQKIQPQQQQRTQQPSFHIGIDLTTPANVTSMTTTTVQAPLPEVSSLYHTHTWIASALAGGIAGSVTWGIVYPVDVIKTKIQTSPLDTPLRNLSMYRVGSSIAAKHGWRRLFRGLGITLIRAFPVNGTIFPVYEFTLLQINQFTSAR